MKQLLNHLSTNPFLLWLLSLGNHLALMIYCYHHVPLTLASSLTQQLALNMVVILTLFSYGCQLIHFKSKTLKLCLILLMASMSWEAVFNQSQVTSQGHFLNSLHVVTTFLLVYSAISILLLGAEQVKEFFQVTLILTLVTVLSSFFHQQTFALLSLFTTTFLTLGPLLIKLIYRRELAGLLKTQTNQLTWLALLLPISYVITYINTSGAGLLNLFWYFEVLLLLATLQFKVISLSLHKKLANIKYAYLKRFSRLLGLVISLLLVVMIACRLPLKQSFLMVNLLLLMSGFCMEELVSLFNRSDMTATRTYLEMLFLKRHTMVDDLLTIADKEQQFSEFLHNDLLQSIIAIKNFNAYGQNEAISQQIDGIATDLIGKIRQRLDYYQPIETQNHSLEATYDGLIARIRQRYQSNKQVTTTYTAGLILLDPYDKIVYRLIEELITNAIKHSSDDEINLSLAIQNDTIFLTATNASKPQEQQSGYGLKQLSHRVKVLGGDITIKNSANHFTVTIVLPIDQELCHEHFVN